MTFSMPPVPADTFQWAKMTDLRSCFCLSTPAPFAYTITLASTNRIFCACVKLLLISEASFDMQSVTQLLCNSLTARSRPCSQTVASTSLTPHLLHCFGCDRYMQLTSQNNSNYPAGAAAASLCGNPGEPSTSQPAAAMSQMASQAASQGVFSSMMAASKVKSRPTAASATGSAVVVVSTISTCCRSQEELLLDRIFAGPADSLTKSVLVSQSCSQGLRSGSSEAQAVSVSQSLWSRASCSKPPDCCLQERVQKRKANAAMEAEKVKKQRHEQQQAEQQQHASDAALSSDSTGVHGAAADHLSTQMPQRSRATAGSADQEDCILLMSSGITADAKSNDRCMLSQSSQAASQVVQPSARSMDLMKRMRLQALEQELKAARQTVLDLERMIKAEELI